MKKLYFYLTLLSIALTVSCNDNDTNDEMTMTPDDSGEMMEEETMEEETSSRYYSLSMGDTWSYDITTDQTETTSDTLTVTGTTTVDNETFSTLEASPLAAGFMTNVFAGGVLRETDSQLLYAGSLLLPFEGNEVELSLPLTPLYDQTVADGTTLSTFTETIEQELEQDGLTIPITMTTTVATTQIGVQENVVINNFAFDSVLTASISVRATITAQVFGLELTVLEEQNILTINNRYAENVGLVASELLLNYEFVDLSALGIELPFPQTGSGQTSQTITSYEVLADD